MPRKHRWLWPSSESRFLRHGNYTRYHYSQCAARPEDVLVPGSDDDADEERRYAKRRKITKLGRAYLDGRPLLIPSALLKGPFGATSRAQHKDKDLVQIEIDTGSDCIAESDPHQLDSHRHVVAVDELDQELLALVDGASQVSDEEDVHCIQGLATRQAAGIHREHDGQGATAEDEKTDQFVELWQGLQEAKRLSQSAIAQGQIIATQDGAEGASLLSIVVRQHATASIVKINDAKSASPEYETAAESLAGGMPEVGDRSDNRASTNDSPFLYRRKRLSDDQSDFKERQFQARANHVPNNDAAQRQPSVEVNAHALGPVNQEAIEEKPVGALAPAMGNGGVAILAQSNDEAILESGNDVQGTNDLADPASQARPLTPTNNDNVPLSTQAALLEAHLDLLKSSPVKAPHSPATYKQHILRLEGSQSPAPAITPFARFDAKFADRPSESQAGQISTQAILDGFSPFKFSQSLEDDVVAPQNASLDIHGMPQPTKDSAMVTANVSHEALGNGDSFEVLAGLEEPARHDSSSVPADAVWTFKSFDQTVAPLESLGEASQSGAPLRTTTPRSVAGLKDKFKVSKSNSNISTPSSKPYSAKYRPLTKVDINRSIGRPQSFSLSQIIDELHVRDHIDIKHIASQTSIKSPSHKSAEKRGKVVDWETSDPTDPEPSSPTKQRSTPQGRRPPASLFSHTSGGGTAKSRSRLSFDEVGPALTLTKGTATLQSEISSPSKSALPQLPRSALRKALTTQRSSMQDGQREDDLDFDASLDELRQSVLGSWDVETAMQRGVEAA